MFVQLLSKSLVYPTLNGTLTNSKQISDFYPGKEDV